MAARWGDAVIEASLESESLQLAYVGLTLAIPVFMTAVVAVVCALLFVLTLSLGVSADSRWIYTAATLPVVAGMSLALGGLKRLAAGRGRRRAIWRLDLALAAGLGQAELGSKAFVLGRLEQSGARVPHGWVVPASAFHKHWRKRPATAAPDTWVSETPVPKRLLRRVYRTLRASSAEAFVLRSSFAGEDGAERAFAGMYRSVRWARSEGVDKLDQALREVWASWWSERALQYRGAGREAAEDGQAPSLSVLINAVVDHETDGFAASADVSTGVRTRHWVEASSPNGAQTWVHEPLSDQIVHGRTPVPPFVMAASRLAAQAEQLLGSAAEVEWGWADGRLWAYQARPLTGLPEVRSWATEGIVALPRQVLSPMSRAALYGPDGPAGLVGAITDQVGLPPLGAEDVRDQDGVAALRVTAVKPWLLGTVQGKPSWREAMRLTGVLVGALLGRKLAWPGPQDPATSGLAGATSASELVSAWRAQHLLPAMQRQNRRYQGLATLDAWLEARAAGLSVSVPPAIAHGVMDQAAAARLQQGDEAAAAVMATLCEPEAELGVPRFGEPGGPRLVLPQAGALPTANYDDLPWWLRWVAHGRDRLAQDREVLNAMIRAANHTLRQALLRLEAPAVAAGTMEAGAIFGLSPDEADRVLAGQGSEPVRVTRFADVQPNVVHERRDEAGQWHGFVPALPDTSAADGALAWGVPTGTGVVHGELVMPSSLQDWQANSESVDAGARRIVVIPSAASAWASCVMQADGVVLLQGGALSHLAMVARERGIPCIAASQTSSGIRPGLQASLDGSRGVLMPAVSGVPDAG